MSLLLQLYGDLPDWFQGHERRLYVFGCKRKACRRKDGSLRVLRAVKANRVETAAPQSTGRANEEVDTEPTKNIGEALFGVKLPTPAQSNPFASPSGGAAGANPFSSLKPADGQSSTSTTPSPIDGLTATFAQKARLTSPTPTTANIVPQEPWPDDPSPYPSYYIDADKEYLEPEPEAVPLNATVDGEDRGSSAADDREAFESTLDKTFQRFADRLAQNPEQVLRYEFAGPPLLYSTKDAVGRLLSPATQGKVQTSTVRNATTLSRAPKIPRCASCGAARVFEFQLTPHAITELEADNMGIEGMDWGTVIVGVCSNDCQQSGKTEGEMSYVEEWVGVQWEEVADVRQG